MPKITSNAGKPYERIGTLLRNLRLRRGLSQFDLAESAGINNSYLSRIENGERRPSPKILKRFSEILQHPYEELVVASGILSEDFVRSTPPVQAAGSNTNAQLQQLIGNIQNRGSRPEQRRAVPVFDNVPAGLLKEANVVEAYADVEKIVLSEDELSRDPHAFALIVQGDSMSEAGILDGDLLIVSPSTKVQNGDIAVALVNKRTTTVKKVFFEGDYVMLQPANSNYKPQLVRYPEEAEVMGKVVLVRRSLF
jgi:repressor LexA